MKISRSLLLGMRNISFKSCRGNEYPHFMFHNLFPKIVPFVDNVEKFGSQRGHRCEYNMVHANLMCVCPCIVAYA